MDFPPNPSERLRVETLAPALIGVLAVVALQPFAVIFTQTWPVDLGDPTWRLRVLSLLLGALPQIAMELALIAAVGLFSHRYRAVRIAAMLGLLLAILTVPALILNWLDMLQVRRMVAFERVRAFDLNALETSAIALLTIVFLFWMSVCGFKAGKKTPEPGLGDVIVIGKDVVPGAHDPRVSN
jgi:hypothetical protein